MAAYGPGYAIRMRTRTIGNDTVGRLEVGAIGLGLMTFDQTGTQPREQLAETITAALDAGVTLFDTADAYGPGGELGARAQGENEQLIASLLDELGVRDRVVLATKGGHVRTDGGEWATDSSRAHLERAVDDSLRRLGVEQLTLCGSTTARTRTSPTTTSSTPSVTSPPRARYG
jgi:aryl-alcohol dehydrogenase-like predicted oxidoreductase